MTQNLSDDFNSASLDPKWSWFNPPSSYSLTARPGWLRFASLTNTNFLNTQHSGQYLYQPVTGDFDMQVHFQTSLTLQGQRVGALVMVDPNNWDDIFRRLPVGPEDTRSFTTVNGVSIANRTLTVTPDYLRVSRTGNVLKTYYSANGSAWTYFSDVGTVSLPATVWVGIMAADGGSGTPVTMDVDYIHFSFPTAAAQVQLETRGGNSTDTADASWTPWSTPYPSSLGSTINQPATYLQYRTLLSTTSPYVLPLLSEVDIAWEAFLPQGTVLTESFRPGRVTTWNLLAILADPQGGAVAIAYSLDGGANWTAVVPGALNLTVPDGLRLLVTLSTSDGSRSPMLSEVRIVLNVASTPPPPPPPFSTSSLPWWAFMLILAPLPTILLLRRLLREPFKPTDLFLIHTDGRLVLRVGGKESPMKDDTAVSAMLTVMARFVRDSFGGTRGAEGSLKAFQVDQREVAIAKGEYLFLALLAEGRRPLGLDATMVRFLRALEEEQAPLLRGWDGLDDDLAGVGERLRWFLNRGYRRTRSTSPAGSQGR